MDLGDASHRSLKSSLDSHRNGHQAQLRELDLKSLPYLTLPRPPVAPQNLIRARSLRPDMTVAKKTAPEAKKTRT